MVPNAIARALSPCFVFRPDTFLRACWRKVRPRPERCLVTTAWGDVLEVEPRKFIGAQLYMRGVHELAVCEILWRLAAPGERVVDVGANIGVMTSLLSKRVGPCGRVYAFEPHPALFSKLQQNSRRWPRSNLVPINWAVSDKTGRARLCQTSRFEFNEGTATLLDLADEAASFEVRTVRLDDALPGGGYGVLKIDVEGHESCVLAGASDLLAAHRVRDVVFESVYPGPAHQLLLALGYHIFVIDGRFSGPKLVELQTRSARQGGLTDYLATLDKSRAQTLIGPAGWKVLRPR